MQSRYEQELVNEMREELVSIGVKEMKTPEEVEQSMNNLQGNTVLFVNSVCGCAAKNARPGLKSAFEKGFSPDKSVSVFAGVDHEATAKAREYIKGHEPSSPCIAIFKENDLVFILERKDIVHKSPEEIGKEIIGYDK